MHFPSQDFVAGLKPLSRNQEKTSLVGFLAEKRLSESYNGVMYGEGEVYPVPKK